MDLCAFVGSCVPGSVHGRFLLMSDRDACWILSFVSCGWACTPFVLPGSLSFCFWVVFPVRGVLAGCWFSWPPPFRPILCQLLASVSILGFCTCVVRVVIFLLHYVPRAALPVVLSWLTRAEGFAPWSACLSPLTLGRLGVDGRRYLGWRRLVAMHHLRFSGPTPCSCAGHFMTSDESTLGSCFLFEFLPCCWSLMRSLRFLWVVSSGPWVRPVL